MTKKDSKNKLKWLAIGVGMFALMIVVVLSADILIDPFLNEPAEVEEVGVRLAITLKENLGLKTP